MDEPIWLDKARGYIDLGMYDEAWNEIETLPPEQTESPEAQEMRIIIMLDRKDLEEALLLSKALCEASPGNHVGYVQGAFSLHALGRTVEAIEHLQSGPQTMRDEPVYFYNLACYEVALGKHQAALTWLKTSFEMDPKFRQRALVDPDLQSIHDLLTKDS